MPSITKEQLAALTEPLLRDAKSNRTDYFSAGDLPAIERIIIASAAAFIKEVQDNLDRMGKVSSGNLSDDISQGELIQTGKNKYELSVGYPEGSKGGVYYDYVNKGVKGLDSDEPANSPYEFRKYSAPPVMVDAIYGWLRDNNIKAKTEDQPRDLSALQVKRLSLRELDPNKSLAYAIAVNIKKKGLPYTGFFDKAITSVYGTKFVEAVSQALGVDVQIQILEGNKP